MLHTLVALMFAVLCIYFAFLVCAIVIICRQVEKEESGLHGERRYRG